MKRIILAIFIVVALAIPAFAQTTYEAVTVAGTAIGFTAATYGRAIWAECRLETAEIRYTKDGSTTPTSTVGIPLEPFEWLILNDKDEIRNFRAIRTTGTSGSLKCHYFSN